MAGLNKCESQEIYSQDIWKQIRWFFFFEENLFLIFIHNTNEKQ